MSSTSRRPLPSGVARTRLRPRPQTVSTDSAPAATATHSTAQTIGTLITALTAIGALVFTGLALNATRDQVAASHRQNEVAQQGQFTDRYTKAVEQLDQSGPEHLQARLGGIYALQRLAVDSPRDQPTIVNVLITFITSTTPRASSPDGSRCPERIAPDVQAAFTVLIDRDRRHDKPDAPEERMVLANACLNRSALTGITLIFANLTGADLRVVDLRGADLRGAYLSGAHLSRAHLTGANLRGAHLSGAHLNGAHLDGADLSGADLSGADLNGADLNGADLRGADLRGARYNAVVVDGTITDSATWGKWW